MLLVLRFFSRNISIDLKNLHKIYMAQILMKIDLKMKKDKDKIFIFYTPSND